MDTKMIKVISGTTTVGHFWDIKDLAARFRPWDGLWQNYWYLAMNENRWIPWREIADAVQEVTA